ncbi:MAG: hypothetical protein HYY89_00215 [candidate division NC10 bacterium]|nr:hypothetical protein [candidate division NC10 bacterium]
MDVKPAHYHRQFANILLYQPTIIDAAIEILRRPEARASGTADKAAVREAFNRHYCVTRLTEDLEKFFAGLDRAVPYLGPGILNVSTDRMAAAMAFLSHTYFLTYTYPPMPFLPFSPMAAQQIAFAEAVDYFEFKGIFARPGHPEAEGFRRTILEASDLWDLTVPVADEPDPVIRRRMLERNGKPLQPVALVKAMIERLGALCPGIEHAAVEKGVRLYLRYLGCVQVVHADREQRFLRRLEGGILRAAAARFGRGERA